MADVFISIASSAIAACSQQLGDKDTYCKLAIPNEVQQEARGVSTVLSREEKNVPRYEDCPLLYFLASIPS